MGKTVLHYWFQHCAIKFPERTAVVFKDQYIRYAELDKKAEELSKRILDCAAEEGIIGISTTRSIEMVAGILAILKSGKAYMPIDPKYPSERQRYMAEISDLGFVVGPENEGRIWDSLGLERIDYREKGLKNTDTGSQQGDLATIIFTSGSTGKPKGVMLGHQGLCENVEYQLKHSRCKEGSKTLQFAHLGFDASILEIFVTLSSGGELHLIEEFQRLDLFQLLKYINEKSINRVFFPNATLAGFVEEAISNNIYPDSLTEITTAGELLKITPAIRQFFSNIPGSILKNAYGPSEASVGVTEIDLTGDPDNWEDIPSIGKAIANCGLLVLDGNLRTCPMGEVGELFISGNCLADGYLNREDLTKERFITWISPEGKEMTLYRTGDFVTMNEGNYYYFKGRQDEQLKIHGNRVELSEIEIVIDKIPGIRQGVVNLHEEISGQKFLCAYLQFKNGDKLDFSAIRKELKKFLPDYMIPEYMMEIGEFPRTSSGKVDKKLLPRPVHIRPDWAPPYVPPSSMVEKNISEVFISILNYDRIGAKDNFFDFGGNSMKAQRTITALRRKFNYNVPAFRFYQYPTVSSLAYYLEGKKIAEIRKKGSDSMDTRTEIAVVGMSFNFPGASTVEELLEVLRNGEETIRFFRSGELDVSISDEERNDPSYVAARGVLEDYDRFDAAFFGFNPKLASIADPQLRKFLEISYTVLEKTGYRCEKDTSPIGVFAGCSNNTYAVHNLSSHRDFVRLFGDFQVSSLNEKDYIASRTAFHLDLTGPAVSVHSACSTSLLAVAQAVEAIRSGKCNIALAGGSSIKSPVFSGHVYEEGGIYSRDGHVNSFDVDAHGTVFSDGVGVVMLKRLDIALEDGDEILAIIRGVGVNNDGAGKASFSGPSSRGQAGAIIQAMEDAGVQPDEISYLEAHATATPIGDPIEVEGLKMAFGDTVDKQYCAIGTVKANLGHLNAASGIAGFIKTVLSLYHKELFPQRGFRKPNPEIDFENSPFYVNTELKPWEPGKKRIAGVSSFGVGGTNVHLVLEEAPDMKKEVGFINPKPAYLISWSAKSTESLELYAEKLATHVSVNRDIDLSEVAHTLQVYKPEYPYRGFIVAETAGDLYTKLNNERVIPTLSKTNGKVVFLFPGEGTQYLNMGKVFYLHNRVFKEAMDHCAAILDKELDRPLLGILFPENEGSTAEEILKNTKYTQPAIFAVAYSLSKLWMSLGVNPMMLCGHSVGEFVAAHLSGVFSLEDALKLVAVRGRMVSSLSGGRMLSVYCKEEDVYNLMPEGLSLAGINGPNQCIVAGETEKIEAFAEELASKDIPNRLLQTNHAFHSHMMDPILDDFRAVLSGLKLHKPEIPIVSTVTGNFLTDTEAVSVDYWTEHLRNPVRFSAAVDTLFSGETEAVFLEVGPGNVLISLCRQSPKARDKELLSSLSKDGGLSDYHHFLKTLGRLWSLGMKIAWSALYEESPCLAKIPTYAFKKDRIWLDPKSEEAQKAMETYSPPSIPTSPWNGAEQIEKKNYEERKQGVKDLVIKVIRDTTGFAIPDPNASFWELGFDSLLLTQLATNLKREFGIKITFRQLNESLQNTNVLVTYLELARLFNELSQVEETKNV